MSYLSQSVQWHLTEACPNRCKHCYIGQSSNIDRKTEELSLPDFIKILDNLARFEDQYNISIDYYTLTGGDPFEHRDFEKLLAELQLRGKIIRILGIPERVDTRNLSMLEQYGVDSYQVSLDGLPKTHDSIRGAGSFQRTIEAIRKINMQSRITPMVMFTLHDKNCDEMFELIDYLDNLDLFMSFSFDFLVFEGNACENFSIMTKDKVKQIMLDYRAKGSLLKKENRKIVLREKVKLFETFDVRNVNETFAKYSYIGGCYCGISSIAILPNGDVYPCRRLPITVGNLLKHEYGDIFLNNPVMRKLRRVSSFEDCFDCDYAKICRGCPALSYSVKGSPFAEMPYCSQKKKVAPIGNEPDINCSEREELQFVTNNLTRHLQQEGLYGNEAAIRHDIYKRLFVLSRSRQKNNA